jgi:hypothetical protein
MKQFTLLSLVGITSIALTHSGWAAGHGGGGGGFGGGGFSGGHAGGGGHIGGGGAGFGGGGFHFSGPHYSSTGPHFVDTSGGYRAGNLHSPAYRPHVFAGPDRGVTSDRSNVSALESNRPATASAARPSQTVARSGLGGRNDHIYARHDGNWHHDWDHRRTYYSNGHWWAYDSGAWIGLDAGFFPWDYYPYYAYDYYPYDYYPGYYADVEPYYQNEDVSGSTPAPDSTVSAVQTRLTQLGYYSGPADGMFGPLTRDAVARYQIANNLAVTGSLSADALQSLGLPQLAKG